MPIFCFNESGALASLVERTDGILSQMCEEYEVILVDDGSTDGTDRVCSELSGSMANVRTVRHPSNRGIGEALRTGYSESRLDYICAIPGDGQFDPSELLGLRPFGADRFVSFYRERTGYNTYRGFLTWFNRAFNRHVLGVALRDVNWVKVYRKEHLDLAAPVLRSSLIETEIVAKITRSGAYPIELPSTYLPRESGQAKGGGWKTLRKAAAETLWLWWVCVRHGAGSPSAKKW